MNIAEPYIAMKKKVGRLERSLTIGGEEIEVDSAS